MTDTTWQESLTDNKARQAARISRAALTVAVKRGVTALTMSSIAEAAGVSRQTLYKYFPDVEAVLGAAVGAATAVDEHLGAIVRDVEEPVARVETLVRAVIEAGLEGHMAPVGLEAALPPAARASLQHHATSMADLIEETIKAGVDAGRFRAPDPELSGRLVRAALLAATDHAAGKPGEAEFITETTLAAILAMLEAAA